MVSYCIITQKGGICTDNGCSLRHDLIRCEPCNCAFLPASLERHQRGRRHLQRVTSNRAQPSTPLETASTIQSAPSADISPPAGGNASTRDTDPRVNVSGEGGLDFPVEGSGTSEKLLFPSTNHSISIERTNVSSCLSLQSVTLRPFLGSCFSASLVGELTTIQKKKARDKGRAKDREFTVTRELRGRAILPGGSVLNGDTPYNVDQIESAHALHVNDSGGGHSSISADEDDEGEELLDTGISVSDEEGLNLGIVERRDPNGPFVTKASSLTIKVADGFPAVTFLEERIRTSDRSDFAFVAAFEGDSHTIQPGTECIVRVTFSPKFEGLFEAELKLVFHDVRLSSRFVVRRRLHGLAVSIEDHKVFESPGQDNDEGPPNDDRYVPPQTVIPLLQPDGRRKKLPDYDVPPIVQEAVDNSTAEHPYDRKAVRLVFTLRPKCLTEGTYAQYFQALLNVEDGQQQCDVLCQPFYVVDVQEHGTQHCIEIENDDEDLLPEVVLGDFVWLDDIQADIRYGARIAKIEVYQRSQGHLAVLKMSLRVPTDFDLQQGALLVLRFRLDRITLRRQYHALASLSTGNLPPRLLFPSAADIGSIQHLSRAEIDNLDLANGNIRNDDQQLHTVVSILEQPQGSVPFIIYGPPGTGKTSALVESIMQLVRRDTCVRVLACTPSNAAADLLIERLAAAGLDSDQLHRLNAYSGEEDLAEDAQQYPVIPERAKLLAFRVVLSTCSSAGMLQTLNVPVGHFSHIVIDEATQAEEPLVMIPILAFSDAYTNVILAGDPNQLGPVIKSPTAAKAGLGRSFLQRLMLICEVYGPDTGAGKPIVALQRNHRSHGAIIAWPNRYLYEDNMRASGDMDVTHFLVNSGVLPKKDFPIVFHSYYKINEALVVRNYCVSLTSDPGRKICPEEIGVIAPYKTQVRSIRECLKLVNLSDISVGSVEQFQGQVCVDRMFMRDLANFNSGRGLLSLNQERKVIIMATTRSNEENHPRRALGFLKNPQRMNVAITRAQSLLILIGDPRVLEKDNSWRTFMNYITSHNWVKGSPSWKATEEVPLHPTEVIPRGRVLYGEEFINGKSENIYKYSLGEG